MSDFKLEVVISNDCDESVDHVSEKSTSDEKFNAAEKILNGFGKQDNRSTGNFATNAERRAVGDR